MIVLLRIGFVRYLKLILILLLDPPPQLFTFDFHPNHQPLASALHLTLIYSLLSSSLTLTLTCMLRPQHHWLLLSNFSLTRNITLISSSPSLNLSCVREIQFPLAIGLYCALSRWTTTSTSWWNFNSDLTQSCLTSFNSNFNRPQAPLTSTSLYANLS